MCMSLTNFSKFTVLIRLKQTSKYFNQFKCQNMINWLQMIANCLQGIPVKEIFKHTHIVSVG